ncbi:hypothetical protein QTQ03_27815 [Micromonospora sp. WMMA1363]|uniref:hypothetical protein n=1 Tax=Micromonospora sp. WMMA1363 TaxID=3053985 RepID=UPI00259CD373|nr:hypothetical protein [Micromonospora sp. WMMA1363]MDM4723224.1 hypothetical protein [Micromonospora sp. WMMA1363]
MRRVLTLVTVACCLLGAAVASTGVALVAVTSPAVAAAPEKRCAVTDKRLAELSGLVATKTGYIVINDGTEFDSRKRVFFLDTRCKIAKDPVRYSGGGPFDTEDLALSPDGKTLWIADTGDNVTSKTRRERVAVWSMPAAGDKRPVLHRLAYPDGKPRDAEALLIGDDGVPLIITKVASGTAEIFTPDGTMPNGDTLPGPMKKVGEVGLPKTETDNPLGLLGRTAITGAARSPDGSRVVLRTYADAFEYDVTDGDVVKALTTGKPRVTALADPFGEAISYSPDGKTFLTVSDGGQLGEGEAIDVLAYSPSTEGAKPVGQETAGPKQTAERSWFDSLSLQDIMYLVGAVGLIGVVLVGAGVFGILRARRRPVDDRGTDDRGPAARSGAAGTRPRGGEYGGAAGGAYGAPAGGPAGPDRGPGRAGSPAGGGHGRGRPGGGGGAVYGGRRSDGGVYGGGAPVGAGRGRPGGNGGRPGGGGGSGGVYGGPSGGAVYGGGRAVEPPRGAGQPDPRPGRRRDDEGRGGQHGKVHDTGRGNHGDRY